MDRRLTEACDDIQRSAMALAKAIAERPTPTLKVWSAPRFKAPATAAVLPPTVTLPAGALGHRLPPLPGPARTPAPAATHTARAPPHSDDLSDTRRAARELVQKAETRARDEARGGAWPLVDDPKARGLLRRLGDLLADLKSHGWRRGGR